MTIFRPDKRLYRRFICFIVAAACIFTVPANAALAMEKEVCLGGQSIGVLMDTQGVTVVGLLPVPDADGGAASPAEQAGIAVGDFITLINDTPVTSNDDIAALIEQAGQNNTVCRVEFIRAGAKNTAEPEPVFCAESGCYRIGLYVRDNTAGIGTLTFWQPDNGLYGALGHPVGNLKYGVEADEIGTIIRASVSGVTSGSAGRPGEKLGVFLDESWQGNVIDNGSYGIYGYIDSLPGDNDIRLLTAEPDEIKIGTAQMYTVLENETVESFDVNIIKVGGELSLTGHCMIIEVTDEDLIARTGGIIQGMSGSPLVQNGKLIGAVTHVFVNNPAKGYACFIQQMLDEAKLLTICN